MPAGRAQILAEVREQVSSLARRRVHQLHDLTRPLEISRLVARDLLRERPRDLSRVRAPEQPHALAQAGRGDFELVRLLEVVEGLHDPAPVLADVSRGRIQIYVAPSLLVARLREDPPEKGLTPRVERLEQLLLR